MLNKNHIGINYFVLIYVYCLTKNRKVYINTFYLTLRQIKSKFTFKYIRIYYFDNPIPEYNTSTTLNLGMILTTLPRYDISPTLHLGMIL